MSLTLRSLIERAQKLAFDNPDLLDAAVLVHNANTDGEELEHGDRVQASSIVYDEGDDAPDDNTVLIVIR